VGGRKSRQQATEFLIDGAENWTAFWDRLVASGDAAHQGAAFERLTQLLLQTQPEYQSKLKHVWLLSEVPEKIRTKLRLPQLDEGIDLVAETHEGTFWAIQSKFRSERDGRLTRKDLDTFTALTFVACTGISVAVVAHTLSKPIRKRHLMGNTVEIGLERWLALDELHWSLIKSGLRGKPIPAEPRQPKQHQQKAVLAASQHFSRKTRGRLIMPCGTGKSLTAFWIAEALEAKNTLVAVPSLALIRQSLEDWTREYLARGERADWLCVCSDQSVADESDSFVEEPSDLGVDTTTDPEKIAKFLTRPTSGPRVTFTTYQSSGRLADAARQAEVAFDLVCWMRLTRPSAWPQKPLQRC
jgi:predicted helicase